MDRRIQRPKDSGPDFFNAQIRIGDIKIMLDCGCPESATTNEVFEKIANEANDVDYIFLSHAN